MLMYTCTKSCSYENVDIFGMMHGKLNNRVVYLDSIIMHSQEDSMF